MERHIHADCVCAGGILIRDDGRLQNQRLRPQPEVLHDREAIAIIRELVITARTRYDLPIEDLTGKIMGLIPYRDRVGEGSVHSNERECPVEWDTRIEDVHGEWNIAELRN